MCIAHLFSYTYNAQDYANPITRTSMLHYPIDGDGGMSQVHHADKIKELPDRLAAPTVRVNGKIFFIKELLQQYSGDYFIPKRFFAAKTSPTTTGPAIVEPASPDGFQLYADGQQVLRSEVSATRYIFSVMTSVNYRLALSLEML